MFIVLATICIMVPPLGIPIGLLGLKFDLRHWKSYIFCLSIAFAIAGYCYNTNGNSDIVRYFAYIQEISEVPFKEVFGYGLYGKQGLFIFNYLCWIVGKLGDPHIIPAISLFVIYYIGLYIACKLGIDYELPENSVILGVVFIILGLNFFSLVNNIRNVLAFVMVGFAVFRDIYLKKRNLPTILLYLMPLFIHRTALLLIAVRLVLFIAGGFRFI